MLLKRLKSINWPVGFCFSTLIICFSILPIKIGANNVYGSPCNGSCSHFARLRCSEETKKCECQSSATLQYNDKAEAICVNSVIDPLHGISSECKYKCFPEQICDEGRCSCKSPNVPVFNGKSNLCLFASFKNPTESCSIQESTAHVCNEIKMSYCKDAKCTCFEGYSYDEQSNMCLLIEAPKTTEGSKQIKREYTKNNGLPGDTCSINPNCVSGLICRQNDLVCACPKQCEYKRDEGGCDCGEVELKSGSPVIIVGIILGIASAVFWFICIRKTYKKLRDKKLNSEFDNPVEEEEEMDFVGQNVQPNQQFNGPDSNLENKYSTFNDPPPAYSSLVNNPNPIGFVAPVPVAPSSESSPWAPSYPVPLQTHNESTPFSNAPLASDSSLPYPITSSPAPNYSALLTDHPTGNDSSLPYPISSPLPTLPSDTQGSSLPYSLVPSTAGFSTSTTASAPELPDSNTNATSTDISSSTN